MNRFKLRLPVVIFFSFISSALYAQKTKAYWQQEVNYNIQVTLNDSTHFLTGTISIEYINHSPDTLRYIWFHLWPNAYKNNSTAFAKQELENGSTEFHYAAPEDRGYIDQLDFRINDHTAATIYDSTNIDIAKLLLTEPLLPEGSITITTPFHVKIPRTFSRFGHVGQSYQITQWYPKPAVYDRFGWHPMPYLDQGEFYSEFGSFHVSVTLPKNYVVGATGTLLNETENKWLDSLAQANQRKFENRKQSGNEPPPSPFEKNKDDNSFPPSDHETKTLQYVADHVHDFAWFADKRYHVMKSHVDLPGKNSTITTWTMFLDKHAAQWKHAIHFVDSAVIYYSKWVGDYPYPQATAVEGALQAGDGMEYPMITVVSGGFGNNKSLETVIAHEVGHNWFYGILAFNEREHPWMDEGINSYYENRYVETRYPDEGLVPNVLAKPFDLTSYQRSYQNYLIYAFQAYRHVDQPMDINATAFTSLNYGGIVYAKTAIVFKYLEAYLTTPIYDELMHQFYNEWAFRHPYPEDLKNFFETNTHKEFDWFFNQSIQTNEYLDYKLVKVGDTTNIGTRTFRKLTIRNKAEIKGPFSITAIKNKLPAVEMWYGGFNGKMDVLFPEGDYDAFRIDKKSDQPEVNRKNNTIRTSGLLPNVEKFRLQWLGSLDNPQRTQLFFTPTIGWNNYDKTWLGLALYNSFLPGKPLSFVVMPSYAFGSNRIIGSGEINLQLFPKTSFIRRIDINSSAKSFDYINDSFYGDEGDNVYRFMKFTQEVQLGLRKSEARSPVNQSITYRNIYVLQEAPESFYSHARYGHQFFNQLTYALQNKRVLNPFALSISLEEGTNEGEDFYLKTFFEGNYTFTYPRKKTGINLRLFTGVMLVSPEEGTVADFHLGATTGVKDYLFDEVYFGRTESTGFLSQQVAIEQGGFKLRTDGVQPELGKSDTWLLSLNAKIPLPFFTPLFAFGDAGIAPDNNNYQSFQFDAGIGFTLVPNIVEVYFPLLFSNDMKLNLNSTEFYDKWYKRISFTVNINQLHPFKIIRNITL
ncbi:MAG: M1 family metallopeptidase [Chitinophagaceae bacterium]|nr:M1 family metallopeptidase [Chitinophagaceae bacterium]